jgi:hypothetical protein
MDVPGKELEKAAAEVGTDVSKSILRGIERLGGAALAQWVNTKEAKAQAARLAIETQAEIERDKQLQLHRHQQEIEEFEHHALLDRRAVRLRIKLAKEQANLESITRQAIEYSGKGDYGAARDLDDDWMFKFVEFAQQVSDDEVQKLWARALTSAATSERPRLPATALQTMALLDRDAAMHFKSFCSVVVTFGFYPAHETSRIPELEIQNINLHILKDFGLIEQDIASAYQFPSFHIVLEVDNGIGLKLFRPDFRLTKRGFDIGNAVFDAPAIALPDELRRTYLTSLVSIQVSRHGHITVAPVGEAGPAPFTLRISKPKGSSPVIADLATLKGKIDNELLELMAWAGADYDIAIVGNPA